MQLRAASSTGVGEAKLTTARAEAARRKEESMVVDLGRICSVGKLLDMILRIEVFLIYE